MSIEEFSRVNDKEGFLNTLSESKLLQIYSSLREKHKEIDRPNTKDIFWRWYSGY